MAHRTEDIRNVALVGHAGAGKTTLLEALLHQAGVVSAPGSVDKGTTVSDFLPAEKARGHSLQPALAYFDCEGAHVNVLDTPGYPDFLGRALSVLPAVETVAVVVNAQSGVELVTERMMAWAAEHGRERLVVINRIDAAEADVEGCLQAVREAFGSECLPLNLPTGGGSGVVDCFFSPDGVATDFSSVAEAHTALVDQVVEVDEALMEVYLEQGEELDPAQLHEPFERALREGHLIPVCFTSARTGAGVPELMRVLATLAPNPTEGNPLTFLRGSGEERSEVTIEPDPDAPAVAHVFKVTIDPFIGRLACFRVDRGRMRRDSQLYVGAERKPVRIGHLLAVQGKDTSEVDEAVPGDLCAVAKVEELGYLSVLHESHDDDDLALPPPGLPEPMYGLAIEASGRGDEQKISDALQRLQAEDPSIRVEHVHALNETVLRGLGDLHLRVLLEDLKERFNVEVATRPPRIAYRETITAPAEGHHRHKKQTGGAGQFGEVFLKVEPLPRGAGFEFVDEVVGGVIPRPLIPAVEKGIRQALEEGVIAGYELQDVRVRVYDGKHHPVDSKEVAFITAGKKAFIDAVLKARPVVLEPIVTIEVTVPAEHVGDVTGDLSGRRGRISDSRVLPNGMTVISAQVPLAEISDYQSQLKAMTGGSGSFTMAFSHYDPVPARTQQQLVEAHRPKEAV